MYVSPKVSVMSDRLWLPCEWTKVSSSILSLSSRHRWAWQSLNFQKQGISPLQLSHKALDKCFKMCSPPILFAFWAPTWSRGQELETARRASSVILVTSSSLSSVSLGPHPAATPFTPWSVMDAQSLMLRRASWGRLTQMSVRSWSSNSAMKSRERASRFFRVLDSESQRIFRRAVLLRPLQSARFRVLQRRASDSHTYTKHRILQISD